MLRFVGRRVTFMVFTLLVMSALVFLLSSVLPGDAASTILGPYSKEEDILRLRHELGTDRPALVQYVDWLAGFVTGDWGQSYVFAQPIRPLAMHRLLNSALLAAFALVIVVPVSVGLGALSGIRRDSLLDRAISTTGIALLGVPEFVSGAILLLLFAVRVPVFPASAAIPEGSSFLEILWHLFLPAVALMLILFGYIARMTRAGVGDVLDSDYVRTATLKGLSRFVVLRRHVLRSALLPTITVIGVQIGWLVGGLVVVETLFNYPGIGKLMLDSALRHDVFVLQATALFIAAIYMLSNFIADLLYALVDPRVRYS